MIDVSIDHFFMVLICLVMVVVAIAWGRMLWVNNFRQWNISEDGLCRCSTCGLIFVVKRVEAVTRCPSCQELTRIRSKKAHNKMTY